MPELLTIDELAERYRVSRWTLYKWVETGRLPHLRVGAQIRFDADRVHAHFEREAEAVATR